MNMEEYIAHIIVYYVLYYKIIVYYMMKIYKIDINIITTYLYNIKLYVHILYMLEYIKYTYIQLQLPLLGPSAQLLLHYPVWLP